MALAVVILVTTRRGRRRRMQMTVVVAWLFHLLLDAVWLRPETFFWPFFGWEFASWPEGPIFARAFTEPWRWVREAAGGVYLFFLWRSRGSVSG